MSNHEKRTVLFLKGNGTPLKAVKSERNKPCRCGSGKKSKNCCNQETKYYNSGK